MITKLIDNFSGILTRQAIGDMESGLAKYTTTFGNDPISHPGQLSWLETPTQIDPTGAVITDLIMAAIARLESGITYVYAVGHQGRLYKIQVNQPSSYNPNYDTPVLLTTLVVGNPTFQYGSSIQIFGTNANSELLYIGHDLGINSVSFTGTGEAAVPNTGTPVGTLVTNVPRPSVQFEGTMYWGNGNNIMAIDSTLGIISYSVLTPPFPVGMIIRDLEISPDGNYLQIVTCYLNAPNLTSSVQDTTSLSSTQSFLALWNGSDQGVTSYRIYNGYAMTSNISFGPYSYAMGYDLQGTAIYSSGKKVISVPLSLSPNFNALMSTGNLLGYASPENVSGFLQASIQFLGQYDEEMPKGGWYRYLRMPATSPETDILQIPVCLTVSNLFYGSSSAGYANNQVGSAKVYFSTLETNSSPATAYRFYKFTTIPTGNGTAIGGVYETQNETSVKLFRNILKQKLKVYMVRCYVQPLSSNVSFQIDLIGDQGIPLTDGTFVFTVGTTAVLNTDICKYNPTIPPQHSVGVRITNLGTANWLLDKLEIDIDESGQ